MRLHALPFAVLGLATSLASGQATRPADSPTTRPKVGDSYVIYAQDQFASGAGSDRFWTNASVPLDVVKEEQSPGVVAYTIRPQGAEVVFDDLGAVAANFGDRVEIRVLRDVEAETLSPTVGTTPITAAMQQIVSDVRNAERVESSQQNPGNDGYRFGVDLPLNDVLGALGLDLPMPLARVRVERIQTSLGRLWLMEFAVAPMTFETQAGDVVLMRHEGFALLTEDRQTLVSGGTRYRGQVAEAASGALVPYEGRRLFALAPDADQPEVLFDATGVPAVRRLIQSYGDPADFAAAAEGDLSDDLARLEKVPSEAEAEVDIRGSRIPAWFGVVRDVAVGLDMLGATAAEAQANPMPMIVLASVPTIIDPMLAFGTDTYDRVKGEQLIGWKGGLAALAGDAVVVFQSESGGQLVQAAEVFGASTDAQLAGPALAVASSLDYGDEAYASFAAAALDNLETGRIVMPRSDVFRRQWVGTSLDSAASLLMNRGIDASKDKVASLAVARAAQSAQASERAESLADPAGGLAPSYDSRFNLAVTNLATEHPQFLESQSRLTVANVGMSGVGSFMGTGFVPQDSIEFSGVGGTGAIRGQLVWQTSADLDLHLILPGDAGEVFFLNRNITFNNGQAAAGLDIDNVGSTISADPDFRIENIVVTGNLPAGEYGFFVDNFSSASESDTFRLTIESEFEDTRTITQGVANGSESPIFTVDVP